MHGIYDAMQAKGQTGPFMMNDGQLTPRSFEEYPKWVTKADKSRVIVQNLREEALMAGDLAVPMKDDPLKVEREALVAEGDKLTAGLKEVEDLKAQMRAQLDELATARAALQGNLTSAKPAPVTPGSTYRLPKATSGATPVAEPEKATG